jgi:hypothetical protein
MKKVRLDILSPFLVALLLASVALPAWGAPQPKRIDTFGNMAIVAQSDDNNLVMGLAHVRTFTSPVAAMAQLANWCGTPSENNPCLVKIMPGKYDLGGATLTMRPYVDIEGSGELTTIITGSYGDSSLPGVVNGADHAELRFLTVKSTSTSGYAVAIANKSQSPKITHVTAIASGSQLNYGMYNSGSSPNLDSVTVSATGGFRSFGIANVNAASPVMNDLSASASNSSTCYGVYNDSSSPVMTHVTAIGKVDGNFYGFEVFGVYNINSSAPAMTEVSASGVAGHFSYGVYNQSSSPVMNRVTAIAKNGTNDYGIDNWDSAPALCEVTAIGSGGTNNFGMRNYATTPVTIVVDRSTFQGLIGISNSSSVNLKIGGSKIIGGASPNCSCTASYNGDFQALGPNCQ